MRPRAFADRVVGAIDRPAAKPGVAQCQQRRPARQPHRRFALAATRKAGAEIAFMNPFGIRAPLDPGQAAR